MAGSNLKSNELSKILVALHTNHPKGVGVFSISKQTNVAPKIIREYFSKYPDYFVQLPNERLFQINRFGKFKGSVGEILKHYERDLEAKKSTSNWLVYLLFISAFVSLSSALVNIT